MWFIHRQIASAIHIIVHVTRMPGGERKIVQISEVTGVNGETVNMHDLFVYRQTGMDEHGRSQGRFEAKGIIPQCLERLERRGWKVSRSYFREGVLSDGKLNGLRGSR